MPTSLAEVYLHLVFATRHRTAWLEPGELRKQLYEYINGICRNLKSPAIQMGGTADHIHILLRMPRDITIATLLREIKRSSTVWLREQVAGIPHFHWQDGYSAFSVSPAHMEVLIRYIQTQEAHHRKVDFKDELIQILNQYKAKYEERYLFD